jgi:hypothetical protein
LFGVPLSEGKDTRVYYISKRLGKWGLKCELTVPSPTLPFSTITQPGVVESTQHLLSGVTTASLAKHPALQHLTDSALSSTVKDILGIQECGLLAAGSKRGEKPLLPVDFVSVIPGVIPGEEDILNQSNGIELVIRSVGSKNLTPDKLSSGQYLEAANTILQILLPTFTTSELVDYVEYQRQVGCYLQIFSVGSVFLLDHAHRKNVFYKKHKWNAIDQCLSTGTLKQKTDVLLVARAGKKKNATQSVPRFSSSTGVPCVNYNDRNRYCQFNPCKDPHICSVEGCTKSHPVYKHGIRSSSDSSGPNP